MGIYSTTSGFAKPRVQRDPRNGHLNPEVRTRIKRILTQAQREENEAVKVYPKYVEYYKILAHGRQCTCTNESIERDIEKVADSSGVNFSDFLMNLTGKLLPEREQCPICFGTGFPGGYYRVGTQTFCFDASLPHKAVKVNTIRGYPYYFNPSHKLGSVAWKFNVPKYFDRVLNVAVKFKEEPNQWNLTVDGSDISEDALLAFQNNTVDLKLEMKDASNINAGFFAIFIQLGVSKYDVQCDMPRLTKTYQGDFNIRDDVNSNITINFDNSVQDIKTTDLVIDDEGFIWRIIQNEPNNPMEVLISNTSEARLVRHFEKYFILPSKVVNRFYNENNYIFLI